MARTIAFSFGTVDSWRRCPPGHSANAANQFFPRTVDEHRFIKRGKHGRYGFASMLQNRAIESAISEPRIAASFSLHDSQPGKSEQDA